LVLIHVSSMNTRRPGSRWGMASIQRRRRRTTSARFCSLAYAVFFERAAFALEKAPDRIVRYGDTLAGEHILELVQGQVRYFFDLRQHEVAMRLEAASLMATELGRRRAARLLQPLAPFHHRRWGELVLSRDRPAGFTRSDRLRHSLPEIVRVRLRHACWPPPQQAC